MRIFNRLFEKKKDSISKLEGIIHYRFKNRRLIETALRHRSSLKDSRFGSNERLEFLGDAVLGLVVSQFLFRRHEHLLEGDLTRLKATLVNETVLARVAASMRLGDFIYLSPEEEKSGGRTKASIIADGFEALVASVFLDGGLTAAEKLIADFLLSDYQSIIADKDLRNYKGELLEYIQAQGGGMPHYRVLNETGPDHAKIFSIGVYFNNRLLGEGTGKSKKEAEQKAACQALEKIKDAG